MKNKKGKVKNKIALKKVKQQAKGITLIALVVTIIVLLILAAVAINLTIGNEGIFTRAQDAVVKNENASVYEQLQMVVADYQIDVYATGNNEEILSRLKSDGYVEEDAEGNNIVNVENLMKRGMQTGKGNKDTGDVYVIEQRQKTASSATADTNSDMDYYLIYYDDENIGINLGLAFENGNTNFDSNIKITISKTPETNSAGVVYLKVQNVEGINSKININEIDISTLSREQKIELLYIMGLEYNRINYEIYNRAFQQLGVTQEEFFKNLEDSVINNGILDLITNMNNEGIETINGYIIVGPSDEYADYYYATNNGNYIFKVKEILTNKTYEGIIEVSNVDVNMPKYYVRSLDGGISLFDINYDRAVFEEAYIIYKGERIDISNCIRENTMEINEIAIRLENDWKKVEDYHELYGTTQTFEIIKDGYSYFADLLMIWAG